MSGSQYIRFMKLLSNYLDVKYNDALTLSKARGLWGSVKRQTRDKNTPKLSDSEYEDLVIPMINRLMNLSPPNPPQGEENISMNIEDLPASGDIYDLETEEDTEDDEPLPEDEDFDAETEEDDDDEDEEEEVKPSRFGGKSHPYYNDFKHIRDRERMKGGGIWGDIWNGVASVLKPALAIFGGPVGAAAGALVPTISNDGGVKMLGQKLG